MGTAAFLTLLGLGALHGLNPGMGWLFAVALGFQERSARAVWRALPPLGLGHALAIAVVAVGLAALGVAVPPAALRWTVAILLVGLGAWRLVRHRHAAVTGMRVGPGELTWWSFLMATAHGAGLMVAPVLLAQGAPAATGHGAHLHHAGLVGTTEAAGLVATGVHTLGYLVVTGALALVVFEKLGLRRLTALWFNVDAAWAVALVVTGVLCALA